MASPKIVDLHVHSNLSDGLYSPEEITKTVLHKNLGGFSLTDHDSFDGTETCLDTLEKAGSSVYFIAGCEFSTYNEQTGDTHILGYFSDYSYRGLNSLTMQFKNSRLKRAGMILDCLKKYHINIPLETLLQKTSSSLGRMHIAREMTRLGYTVNVHEAFEKYLGDGRPCNIQRKDALTYDIISSIIMCGGIPVLAHPVFLKDGGGWKFLDRMISEGLLGIEYIHPRISGSLSRRIKELYSRNMILTAGSDFHGDDRNDELGRFGLGLESAGRLLPPFSRKAATN
jgi:hypothetical protein